MESLSEDLQSALRHPSWKVRRNALVAAQGLFYHNVYQAGAELRAEILSIVADGLQDTILEVRDQAGITLSGLLRCDANEDAYPALQESFLKVCAKASKKKSTKTGKPSKKQVSTLHGSVLGITSLLQTHPYDLPDWAPGLLTVLGGHLSAQEPVAGAVRKTFTEFWRTHREGWDEMKQGHDPEELEVLRELFFSPLHYFA